MSCNYADGLSPYENKGKCGLPERFDSDDDVSEKVSQLAAMFSTSHHVVVFTGAGISTASGIPDFRGPNGVWTLQNRGERVPPGAPWHMARPTATHMALTALVEASRVQLVVSQNVDGLHLRSSLPRSALAELHGNVFLHKCAVCGRQFVRGTAVPTVGERSVGACCPGGRRSQRGGPCRGKLYDTVLDWEAALPATELQMAESHAQAADLVLCLGTSLQIVPCADLPLLVKRRSAGKLVICNLQPTKHDRRADLVIATYVDTLMTQLLDKLGVPLPDYCEDNDPTRWVTANPDLVIDWTLTEAAVTQPELLLKVKQAKTDWQEKKNAIKRQASSQPSDRGCNQKRRTSDSCSPSESSSKEPNRFSEEIYTYKHCKEEDKSDISCINGKDEKMTCSHSIDKQETVDLHDICKSESNVNSENDKSESNVNSGSDKSEYNVNSGNDKSESNVNSVNDKSESNINNGSDNSESNVNSGNDKAESNVNSASEKSESNVNNEKDKSESNVNSGCNKSESNVYSGNDKSESNINSGNDKSESIVYSGNDESESNVYNGSDNSESIVYNGNDESESNVNSGSDNSKSNVNGGCDKSESNVNSGNDKSDSNVNSGRDKSESNVNSGNDKSESNVNSGNDKSQSNVRNDEAKSCVLSITEVMDL